MATRKKFRILHVNSILFNAALYLNPKTFQINISVSRAKVIITSHFTCTSISVNFFLEDFERRTKITTKRGQSKIGFS
jgi:hypothetical protein